MMRYIDDDVLAALARVNADLARRSDPARARFAKVQPDPYSPDDWLVIVTWELPAPARGEQAWPLATLDRYGELARKQLEPFLCYVHSEFRTSDEFTDDLQLGRPIQELV
jgi:hypothetical protein